MGQTVFGIKIEKSYIYERILNSTNKAFLICQYQASSAGRACCHLGIWPQFSYHNRVTTLWAAVITAVSSNQHSKAVIKPSGTEQTAGVEVTLDLCMCVCVGNVSVYSRVSACMLSCFYTYEDQHVPAVIEIWGKTHQSQGILMPFTSWRA